MLLTNGKKRIPIGYEDFKQLIDSGFYYVDKSMLIYELLHSGGQNNLITRPRRFGKTLNFSMLKYFFDINEKDNAYLFDGLKISEHYEELAMYRNTHPVITLSLKCAKQGDYDKAIYSLRNEIQYQFKKYSDVLKSEKIDVNDRKRAEEIMAKDVPDTVLGDSIKLLCLCLKQYYGVNTIILIDEYDVPLEDAYFSGYYDKMVQFIRSLFESALKTNPTLEFSVMTGCLRISKESSFTGLNNLAVNSILSNKYSESFGFVQSEVDELMEYYNIEEKSQLMKKWYDGYLLEDYQVYNPKAVVSVMLKDKFRSYWSETGSYEAVVPLINMDFDGLKTAIIEMLAGNAIEVDVGTFQNDMNNFYCRDDVLTYLIHLGYLAYDQDKERAFIPNEEVRMELIKAVKRRKWDEMIQFQQSSMKLLEETLDIMKRVWQLKLKKFILIILQSSNITMKIPSAVC